MSLIELTNRKAWHAFTTAKQAGKDDFDALADALAATQLEAMQAEIERRGKIIEAMSQAIELADVLILNNVGTDTPKEWDRAYKKTAEARASLSQPIDDKSKAT